MPEQAWSYAGTILQDFCHQKLQQPPFFCMAILTELVPLARNTETSV